MKPNIEIDCQVIREKGNLRFSFDGLQFIRDFGCVPIAVNEENFINALKKSLNF